MGALEDVLLSLKGAYVIDSSIPTNKYVFIDLSKTGNILRTQGLKSAKDYEVFLQNYVAGKNAVVAYGGYLEHRNLYEKSDLFNDYNTVKRDIHIGMDFWMDENIPVLAALEGKVHSFNNNIGLGNYGPTIILEHNVQMETFYTLYGHLSVKSIENIDVGDVYKKGQRLASLGNASVNGGYAPHLHFQLIKNIAGYFGDYPGVCSKDDLEFYMNNCPDPNLLLKINQK